MVKILQKQERSSKFWYLTLVYVLFALNSFAQSSAVKGVEGTYQIQVIDSRSQPYIPGNLSELVLNNRHKTDTVYIKLGEIVRLQILPSAVINNESFKPLAMIAHIKSDGKVLSPVKNNNK